MTRPLYLSRARLRRDASVATLLPLLQGGTSRNGHSQHSDIISFGPSSHPGRSGAAIFYGVRWNKMAPF